MILFSYLVCAYLIGSLSFAIIVSKSLKMNDPRSYGSGNAGATNVMRSGNKLAAVLTLAGDFLKGLLVVVLAYRLSGANNDSITIASLCGILVIIGHVFPIFFKFKGGKGVATAAGVIAGINLYLFICVILAWVVVFKITKVSSLSAILATALSPVFAYFILGNGVYFGAVVCIAVIIILTHKQNIIRLITGQEHAFKKK